MTAGSRRVVAIPKGGLAAAMLSLALVGVAGYALLDADAEPSSPRLAAAVHDAAPASGPFPGLTETTLTVGDERLRVVVADDERERYRGLRGVAGLGGYDGMLFVYDESSTRTYTMSTVPVALDIGFYDGRGRLLRRFRMEPCPSGEDCPSYPSEVSFRYALETIAGQLPAGPLRAP